MPYTWTTGETITAAKLNPVVTTLTAAITVNTYTSRASLTVATSEHQQVTIGNTVYMQGGFTTARVATSYAYDVATNSWSTKASAANTRQAGGAFTNGTDYYVVNGLLASGSNTNTTELYTVATNTWSSKATTANTLRNCTGDFDGTYGYAIGGFTGSVNSNRLEQYDLGANTWTSKATMGTARSLHSSGVISGKIYVAGNTGPSGTSEEYTPGTNTWTNKATMATARYQSAYAVNSTDLYLFGGNTGSNSSVVEAYNASSNTWSTKAALGTARYGARASTVGNNMYVTGGYTTASVNTHERYAHTGTAAGTYTAVQNCIIAAYSSGVTLTNGTTSATGAIVSAKSGDVISTNIDTEVIII